VTAQPSITQREALLGRKRFYLWSIPFEQATGLATPDVAPLRFEDRAWLAAAAVRFRSLRLGPLPVAGNAADREPIRLAERAGPQTRGRIRYVIQYRNMVSPEARRPGAFCWIPRKPASSIVGLRRGRNDSPSLGHLACRSGFT
jgi:hypothetical protein